MTYLRSSLLLLPLLVLVAACGDSTTPPLTDAGGTFDMGTYVDSGPTDAGSSDDASTPLDGAPGDDASVEDAGGPTDMCTPPRCPPIPLGCRVEPSPDPCTCGVIKCEDGGGVDSACGGRAGRCATAFFCDFAAAYDCGFADGTGTCQPRPEICSSLYAPVCGCDGSTYSNDCVAHSAGTDVLAEGACEVDPPPHD